MPQTNDEKGANDGTSNRVSNMPLLFADGYPTSLNKITEPQLEKFIPFMVQCSLGYIHIHSLDQFRKPEWWPREVEFTKPFRRPKSFTGNWLQTMREIVVVCYSFHDCIYLLRYCSDLASYQPTSLRFINNYNSTTSLYERGSNKLLVTFRNENMLYDQEKKINSRKCLLPKQSSSQYSQAAQEEMVISEGFEIYLCDNCDGELYSYGALVEHEKECLKEQNNHKESSDDDDDDDDVIFCGEVFDQTFPLGSSARAARTEQQKKLAFLAQNFTLLCVDGTHTIAGSISSPTKAKSGADVDSATAIECTPEKKHRRLQRRARHVMTLARCPQIPLSSPLGQAMLKSTKATCTPEYIGERFDRSERFCHAPPLPPGTGQLFRQQKNGTTDTLTALERRLPKWLFSKPRQFAGTITYKRPADAPNDPYRQYKYPRRQFSSRHRLANFLFYNKPLIERCRPCLVRVKRLNSSALRFLTEWPGVERRKREAEQAAQLERQRRKELAARAMIVDSIDLCSSEEEEELEEDHPAARETDEISEESRRTEGIDEGGLLSESTSLEMIVLGAEGAGLRPQTYVLPTNNMQNASVNCQGETSSALQSNKSPLNAKLLSEVGLRLKHPPQPPGIVSVTSLPTVSGNYLYTNCNRTETEISQMPGAKAAATTVGDSNRSLKENLVTGWLKNDLAHAANVGTHAVPVPVPVAASPQPSTTMLLATPNGHRLIPLTFSSGPVGLESRVNASTVQTLTTASFVNQNGHRKRLSVARTGVSTATVVSGATAANLQ